MAKDFYFYFSQWFIDLMAFALFVMEEQFKNPNQGFKNQYGKRTGKCANYQFYGRIGVRLMVEPVTL